MQSRRQWAKTGFAGLVMLNESRSPAIARQEITAETVDLTYQGMLATNNLPDLSKAPEGECAVVMRSYGPRALLPAMCQSGHCRKGVAPPVRTRKASRESRKCTTGHPTICSDSRERPADRKPWNSWSLRHSRESARATARRANTAVRGPRRRRNRQPESETGIGHARTSPAARHHPRI